MTEKKKEGEKKEGNLLGVAKSALIENKGFFLATSFGLFVAYTFFYGLWKIPVIGFGINRLSQVTISDYLFIVAITSLAALFITLWRYERKHHVSSHSAVGSVGGGVAGIVSAVCPACQGIGVVGLGVTFLNIPTAFLLPYLGIIKVLSLGLLGLAVFLKADSIHTKTCRTCVIPSRSKNKKIKKQKNAKNAQ